MTILRLLPGLVAVTLLLRPPAAALPPNHGGMHH